MNSKHRFTLIFFLLLTGFSFSQNKWDRVHTFHGMRICMMTEDTIFVYGNRGAISKSKDRGQTWQYFNYPMNEDILEMCFPVPATGYFVNDAYCSPNCTNSRIFRSINYGCTWEPVAAPSLAANEKYLGLLLQTRLPDGYPLTGEIFIRPPMAAPPGRCSTR